MGDTGVVLEPTFRPLITVIRITPDRSTVEVALDLDGRVATGFADVEDDDSTTAACRGTIAAVQTLLPDHLQLELEWCQKSDRPDGTSTITSAVVLHVHGGARTEHLLGAAFVRHDPDVAAVRATLDGLTRRLVTYLFE
jgi:hypothetical protein